MKKTFSVAMLIVGSIIGAGFASGQEIYSFFRTSLSPITAIICGFIVAAFSAIFMLAAKFSATSDLCPVLFKRCHPFARCLLLFNCLIISGGMLAALNSLFAFLSPLPLFGILGAAFCLIAAKKGNDFILNFSLIIVPFVLLFLLVVCLPSSFSAQISFSPLGIPTAVLYIGMNMILALPVISKQNKLTTKQIITASAIAGIFIAAVMSVIMLAVSSMANPDFMPVLNLAANLGKPVVFIAFVVITLAILTSLLSSFFGARDGFLALNGDGKFSSIMVVLAALIISNIGFEKVVRYLYPFIGLVGLIFVVAALISIIKNRRLAVAPNALFNKSNTKIHKRGKHAKNGC